MDETGTEMRPGAERPVWLAVLLMAVLTLLAGPALAGRDADAFKAHTQRNPFRLPGGVYYKAPNTGASSSETVKEPDVKVETTATLPALILQAVVWGGPQPVAVINNDNFVVGDAIYGREIVDIGRDEVVLMGDKKAQTLRLKEVPLKVERTLP